MTPTTNRLSILCIRALVVLRRFDAAPCETILAFFAFVWGAWFWISPAVWGHSVFTLAPAWAKLATLMNDLTYGTLYMIVGTMHLFSIGRGGYESRRLSCLISSALWGFTEATYFASVPGNVTTPAYTIVALSLLWLFIRLGYRRAD